MTNDPSMTITSTVPAPEGSDSTRKGSNTIPLPVTEGGNAPLAPDTPQPAIANTKGDGEKSGEDFWAKAEALYYQALIAYIWYEAPEEEMNMTTLLDMLNASEVREEDESFKNAVDLMFEQLEQRDPDHFAVRQYRKYKLAAGVVCSK